MAAAEKKGTGLALIFGGDGKKTPPLPAAKGEPDGDEGGSPMPDKGTDEPSEAFKTAVQETGLPLDDEQTAAFWRAIKECAGSY